MPSYELTKMHSHRHPFLGAALSEGELVQEGDIDLFEKYGVAHGAGVFSDQNSIFQNVGDADGIFSEGPFAGDYEPLIDADPEVQAAKVYLENPGMGTAPQVSPEDQAKTVKAADPVKLVTPVVTGILRATVSYGVLRYFNVEKQKARKAAITLGVLEAVGGFAGNWLRSRVGDLQALKA